MTTATVQMVVSIEVDVNVDNSLPISELYSHAAAAAREYVASGNRGVGMNISVDKVVSIESVIAKSDQRPQSKGY